jgi:hypothetical protein
MIDLILNVNPTSDFSPERETSISSVAAHATNIQIVFHPFSL